MTTITDSELPGDGPDAGLPTAPRRPRALTLDVARYEQYLDDPALNPEQKRQFIEALWSIVVAFVDLGFSVEAEEAQDEEACGKLTEAPVAPAVLADDVVNLEDISLGDRFDDTARGPATEAVERIPT